MPGQPVIFGEALGAAEAPHRLPQSAASGRAEDAVARPNVVAREEGLELATDPFLGPVPPAHGAQPTRGARQTDGAIRPAAALDINRDDCAYPTVKTLERSLPRA